MRCNVVIPCAGHAQRFANADFPMPKPLIRVRGSYMFERSVDSLKQDHVQLHFIVLEDHVTRFKIDEKINDVYEDAKVHAIGDVLPGCVETVLSIKDEIDNQNPLIIQNVDVAYAPELDWVENYDPNLSALILTAESDSQKHSYVRVNEDGHAIEFAEKKVISSHAVVGTYYFMRGADFIEAARTMQEDEEKKHNGEWYVTPSLSYLKSPVRVVDVRKFYPLGTPYDVYLFIEGKEDERL